MMACMAEVVVVTGPPGAGKSSVAAELAGLFWPSALVSGDVFFGFIKQGYIPPWTAEAHQQNLTVVTAAAMTAGRLAGGGYTVIYDGVVGPWFLPEFMSAAGAVSLQYVVLVPPERVCVERVRNRVGHGFTDPAATRHMHAEFAGSGIDPRHLIESESPTAGELAAALFEQIQAGQFRVTRPPRAEHGGA